jgi:hypothetical protein
MSQNDFLLLLSLNLTHMKKSIIILSALIVGFVLLPLSSCKDDGPPPKAKISFAESTMTVNEADGTIEIEVVLDKPATENTNIEYEVNGTAQDFETATQNNPPDFQILQDISDYGEVDIAKGETSGIIEIEMFSDTFFEDNETIEISITAVNSDQAELTTDVDMEITLEQEDGMLVILSWDYADVDLDLFLWAEDNVGTLGLTNLNSAGVGFDGPEGFFLPTALLDDGSYGLSCTYYEGTANPMNFEVDFIEIINGNDVATTTKSGTYSLANINKWDDATNGTDPVLVQTFQKTGIDFSNFSAIETPSSGSRIQSSQLPNGVIKTQTTKLNKSLIDKFN